MNWETFIPWSQNRSPAWVPWAPAAPVLPQSSQHSASVGPKGLPPLSATDVPMNKLSDTAEAFQSLEALVVFCAMEDAAFATEHEASVKAALERLTALSSQEGRSSSSGDESTVSKSTEQRGAPLDQIKHMTDRFLGWKLPTDFRPDNGISYVRPGYAPSVDATPYGTNLFDSRQAEAMVRYIVEGLPPATDENEAEGCAEREVGRYVYKLIAARMDAKSGTPEGRELTYLARIVSDVEEYGADKLAIPDLGEPAPEFAAAPSTPTEDAQLVHDEPKVIEGDGHRITVLFPDGQEVVFVPDASRTDQTEGGE